VAAGLAAEATDIAVLTVVPSVGDESVNGAASVQPKYGQSG